MGARAAANVPSRAADIDANALGSRVVALHVELQLRLALQRAALGVLEVEMEATRCGALVGRLLADQHAQVERLNQFAPDQHAVVAGVHVHHAQATWPGENAHLVRRKRVQIGRCGDVLPGALRLLAHTGHDYAALARQVAGARMYELLEASRAQVASQAGAGQVHFVCVNPPVCRYVFVVTGQRLSKSSLGHFRLSVFFTLTNPRQILGVTVVPAAARSGAGKT